MEVAANLIDHLRLSLPAISKVCHQDDITAEQMRDVNSWPMVLISYGERSGNGPDEPMLVCRRQNVRARIHVDILCKIDDFDDLWLSVFQKCVGFSCVDGAMLTFLAGQDIDNDNGISRVWRDVWYFDLLIEGS